MTAIYSRLALALALVLGASGCSSIGSITGAVAGTASGGASANPAVGIAVGIGVRAVVDETIKGLLKRWSDEEQTRIAQQIGLMAVGERQPWDVRHAVPYNNTHGQVQVVRVLDTALVSCKEALFSIATDKASAAPDWFLTTVCQGPDGWRWAAAEPAVSRWGGLQ
ncbi:MAG: hypothetical protein ACRYGK_02105 [Janthinobacterium lividum]